MPRPVPLLSSMLFLLAMAACSSDSGNPVAPGPGSPPDVEGARLAFERNQKLARGINLGNALEAPNEGDWGVVLQQWFFDKIAEAGFTAVRIPVRWSGHAASGPPYQLDQVFLARVRWAVDNALERNLMVVLNMHHYEEIMQDPRAHEQRFLAIWQQVAEAFKSYPGELIFEPLNEPNNAMTAGIWNQYLAEAIVTVRASNPGRTILAGPANWNNINALPDLRLPEDDRNIIVSVHYYEPFRFTHQGASWVSGSEAWRGTTWLGNSTQRLSVTAALTAAANWALEKDRPLHLGEFGAIIEADMDSRATWTGFVTESAESLGLSWSYWDFCANFAVYDKRRDTWHTPILNALLRPDTDASKLSLAWK